MDIKKVLKSYKIILTMIILCGIIIVVIKSYAEEQLGLRGVTYNSYTYKFYTDSIKFHSQANGYSVMQGMECANNYWTYREIGPGIYYNPPETIKSKGYGNYVFTDETNLYKFLEWCHSRNQSITELSCIVAGPTEAKSSTYTKLIGYANQNLDKDAKGFMNAFWTNMSIFLGDVFYQYQDEYFFEKYIVKGLDKIGMTLGRLKQVQNNEDYETSIKEYLTCLSSYMYSLTPSASPDTFTVGKGDVVPFLYYKRYKEEINPKELARYAYISLIEGWCSSLSGMHLWEREYEELYGLYNPEEYDLEKLKMWYDDTYEKYKGDKGRKGNSLLGSDITTIIKSDYSIETQLEATENYLNRTFSELGIERSYKENIERNQLMAEYMMQDSRLDETIKDYNVSIKFLEENLQRGTFESENTNTAVLSDYQFITFNHPLNVDSHSDKDTLSDLTELSDNYKWMDITAFVKKTYNHMKANGEVVKATFEEQVEDIIIKNGKYIDFNDNEKDGFVKWDETKTKVLYRTYDYKSNPILSDTDFDGIDDKKDSDKSLKNRFKGSMMMDDGSMEIDYNNDFRWFYTDSGKYNDELAVMSFIMSKLSDGGVIVIDHLEGLNNMRNYMLNLGFSDDIKYKNEILIGNNEKIKSNIYIGQKEIDYYGKKKTVCSIFVGGLDKKDVYKKLLVNSDDKKINEYYKNIANDIIKSINEYEINDTKGLCYWVVGKGISGAVANIVGKMLIDKGNETFCYTFGAPSNNINPTGVYSSIKNIINEDDLIPKLLKSNNSFNKYGTVYNGSVKYDYKREYIDLFEKKNYRGNYMITNHIANNYKNIRKEVEDEYFYDRLSKYLEEGNKMYQNDFVNTKGIGAEFDMYKNEVLDAKSSNAYYALSKNLNGYKTAYNNNSYNESIELPNNSDMTITSKNLVTGDGSFEYPYYSEFQSLSIEASEKDIWCMFHINGSTIIDYSIPTEYNAEIHYYSGMIPYIYGYLKGEGKELIYERSKITNGEHTYTVHLTKNENFERKSKRNKSTIFLSFKQYQDVNVLDDCEILQWSRDERGILSEEEIFKNITYVSKEYVPTIVFFELNNDSEIEIIRNKIANGIIDLGTAYQNLKMYSNIILFMAETYLSGGIISAVKALGIKLITNYALGIPDNCIRKFLSNRYSTENYHQSLKDEAGYYIEVVYDNTSNDYIYLSLCGNDIALYEKYFDPLTYLGGAGVKMCKQLKNRVVYGTPGVVGYWIGEN